MVRNLFSNKILGHSLLFTGVATFLFMLSSCKGSTADNMVPTGDTVEVVILQPLEQDATYDSELKEEI